LINSEGAFVNWGQDVNYKKDSFPLSCDKKSLKQFEPNPFPKDNTLNELLVNKKTKND
jgi:hypothetical protein